MNYDAHTPCVSSAVRNRDRPIAFIEGRRRLSSTSCASVLLYKNVCEPLADSGRKQRANHGF